MQIILISSNKNLASMNMHKLLVNEYNFKQTDEQFDSNYIFTKQINGNELKLITCNKDILEIEYVKEHFNPDLYLILSTHKSEANTKSLSCHISGDWKKGVPPANPNVLRSIYLGLLKFRDKFKLNSYEVTLEVTHHQPYDMNSPSVWVEVGGSEIEWNDLNACRACCETILDIDYIDYFNNPLPIAVGFGGPHYAPNFIKDYLLEKIAVGHICSKHAIDTASEEVILDAFVKSKSKLAIIDWKGTVSVQRQKLKELFESNNIEWKKVTDFKG